MENAKQLKVCGKWSLKCMGLKLAIVYLYTSTIPLGLQGEVKPVNMESLNHTVNYARMQK